MRRVESSLDKLSREGGLLIQLVEIFEGKGLAGKIQSGPYSCLLEVYDASGSAHAVWRQRSPVYIITSPPIMFNQSFRVGCFGEWVFNISVGWRLEIFLCKESKGRLFKVDKAVFFFDEILVNKTTELDLPMEKDSGFVKIKMDLTMANGAAGLHGVNGNPKKLKEVQNPPARGLQRVPSATIPLSQLESVQKDVKHHFDLDAVNIVFTMQYNTVPGQIVCVSGSNVELGEWDIWKAKKLSWSYGNLWRLDLLVPKTQIAFEYKYFIWNEHEKRSEVWESIANRRFAQFADFELKDKWDVLYG